MVFETFGTRTLLSGMKLVVTHDDIRHKTIPLFADRVFDEQNTVIVAPFVLAFDRFILAGVLLFCCVENIFHPLHIL